MIKLLPTFGKNTSNQHNLSPVNGSELDAPEFFINISHFTELHVIVYVAGLIMYMTVLSMVYAHFGYSHNFHWSMVPSALFGVFWLAFTVPMAAHVSVMTDAKDSKTKGK